MPPARLNKSKFYDILHSSKDSSQINLKKIYDLRIYAAYILCIFQDFFAELIKFWVAYPDDPPLHSTPDTRAIATRDTQSCTVPGTVPGYCMTYHSWRESRPHMGMRGRIPVDERESATLGICFDIILARRISYSITE